jgi:hypothetical protein
MIGQWLGSTDDGVQPSKRDVDSSGFEGCLGFVLAAGLVLFILWLVLADCMTC